MTSFAEQELEEINAALRETIVNLRAELATVAAERDEAIKARDMARHALEEVATGLGQILEESLPHIEERYRQVRGAK